MWSKQPWPAGANAGKSDKRPKPQPAVPDLKQLCRILILNWPLVFRFQVFGDFDTFRWQDINGFYFLAFHWSITIISDDKDLYSIFHIPLLEVCLPERPALWTFLSWKKDFLGFDITSCQTLRQNYGPSSVLAIALVGTPREFNLRGESSLDKSVYFNPLKATLRRNSEGK